MTKLAEHYDRMRKKYPDDPLLILFDIDGTILDMRYMVWRLLQDFDMTHNTVFFSNLQVSDIVVHEDRIAPLLEEQRIPLKEQQQILAWYQAQAWSSAAILEAHRPFSGVLDVIRWFQMQPNTFVGVNTARPESFGPDTLRSLNNLGQEYKVEFANELLYLRPDDWGESAPSAKAAGVRRFQQAGYRVVAFVDNEPENLAAVATVQPRHEILLLHADTIFKSKRAQLPPHTVTGQAYNLAQLISEEALPSHIHFVWQGIGDPINCEHFLESDVHWGQLDVRPDPQDIDLLLSLGALFRQPVQPDTVWRTVDTTLARLHGSDKGIKLDLIRPGVALDQTLWLIEHHNWEDSRLWFSGRAEHLNQQGFQRLVDAHPHAIIECPVDFLAPLICSAPLKSKQILDRFRNWGVNRFSIEWRTPNLRPFLDQMDQWGFEVNIQGVPDLESFLRAVLLTPRSITTAFNWRRFRTQFLEHDQLHQMHIHELASLG